MRTGFGGRGLLLGVLLAVDCAAAGLGAADAGCSCDARWVCGGRGGGGAGAGPGPGAADSGSGSRAVTGGMPCCISSGTPSAPHTMNVFFPESSLNSCENPLT